MSTKLPAITTAEQLAVASGELGPCELVQGELIMMTPAKFRHGLIESQIQYWLKDFVRKHNLGTVTPGDTGFLLERDPDTVRAPDVAFVRAERLPVDEDAYFPGPPDLAVEIRSPDDRPKEISEKIAEYLRLGVQVVWDVDPAALTVTVHRPGTTPQTFSYTETLTEPALLPGFELAVKEIFAA